ncbi:synaptotagmin-2 [Brachionichthys hirsutus]|uniref:synaptotagmin-2 n=1 Tax=Brachionichthys hirsutus TaxID=412623 RepID=UPI0036047224
MAMFAVYPAPVGVQSAAEVLKFPFADSIKYGILGVSIALLLLALALLAWQTFRYCTQTNAAYRQQVNGDLVYSDGESRAASNYSGAPSTRVRGRLKYLPQLPRGSYSCRTEASFTSSGCSRTDGHVAEEASANKVEGSLRFSIYYDRLQSQLVVTVMQLEGLLDLSQKLSLQPLVKISLMWAGSEAVEVEHCTDEEGEETPLVLWQVLQEWKTRVVKHSCNPLFGDQFSCILHQHMALEHVSLKMQVRDFDKFSRQTVLGEVRVALGQLNISYPLELQEDLQIPHKDLVGEVLLSLKFLPTSQRLEIGLLKVRTVFNEICSDAALHARISVQCNQCKLRYQKSSLVARCPVTVFNEVFLFALPEIPLQQCKILVSVYETHMMSKPTKHLIGQLTVGKKNSSEDRHWSMMMHSVRQPVATWHGLLI